MLTDTKTVLVLWSSIPKVPKITSLQYLDKNEARDKYNILNEDDHRRFFEADTIIFGGHIHACPKY